MSNQPATTRQAVADREAEQQAATPGTSVPSKDARLAIVDDQPFWTGSQLSALRSLGMRTAGPKAPSEGDLAVFFHYCRKTGLDPFIRQIYLIPRQTWNDDIKAYEWRQTIQVGIDGFRVQRERAARRDRVSVEFEETVWYDEDGRPYTEWLWDDRVPTACKVVLLKNGYRFPAVLRTNAYIATKRNGDPAAQWAVQADHMIEKCFMSDTEVLTDAGFRLFADVGSARIAQVTEHGIELVRAIPFAQRYDGPMIGYHGERLDFSVTPNHDMMTTAGKVEAETMLNTATHRPRWRIPLTAPGRSMGLPVTQDRLRLAGYFLADGYAQGRRALLSVSRPRKIAALNALGLHCRTTVKKDAGRVSSGPRPVRTRSDKVTFVYDLDLLSGTGVSPGKRVSPDSVVAMSQEQARAVLDAWADFDGTRQGPTCRLGTSNQEHVGAIELLAAAAGYTVSVPRKRDCDDLSSRPHWVITISATRPTAPVARPWRDRPGIGVEPNADGWVWCVTVPSHLIIVRRNGMAMISGQCCEAFGSRRAFPADLGGLYIEEEMGHQPLALAQAERPPQPARSQRLSPPRHAGPDVDADTAETDRLAAEQAAEQQARADAEQADARDRRHMHALFRDLGLGGDKNRPVRLGILAILAAENPDAGPLKLSSSAELSDDEVALVVSKLRVLVDDRGDDVPALREALTRLARAGGWDAEGAPDWQEPAGPAGRQGEPGRGL